MLGSWESTVGSPFAASFYIAFGRADSNFLYAYNMLNGN